MRILLALPCENSYLNLGFPFSLLFQTPPEMKCSRMHLSDRRYKPPPRVSKCGDTELNGITRQCAQRYNLTECPAGYRSRPSRYFMIMSHRHKNPIKKFSCRN